MELDVTIRMARSEDNAPISKMIFEVLKEYGIQADPEGDDSDAKEFGMTDDRIYLVAARLEAPIGSAILTPEENGSFKLSKLFLARRDRGKGIGKLLLNAAVAAARSSGGEEIYLRTRDSYAEAIRLYERYGWTRHSGLLPPPGAPVKYSLRLARMSIGIEPGPRIGVEKGPLF